MALLRKHCVPKLRSTTRTSAQEFTMVVREWPGGRRFRSPLALSLLLAGLAGCAASPRPSDPGLASRLDCPNARAHQAAEATTPGILQRLTAETVARCIEIGAL
jgi:hypothetical protein